MRLSPTILAATISLAIISCGKSNGSGPEGGNGSTLFQYDRSYTEDVTNFCNPERGLYVPNIHYFRNGRLPSSPATAGSLRSLRGSGKTLSFSEFYMMDYVYRDFTDEVLEFIRRNFEVHRDAGVKTIVRFAYSDGYAESDHPWDAPLEQTLRHVAQLKPIFHEFEDVIYVVQYGFVGSWGEGYYTDYYGMNPRTDEEYWPRRQLMNALLDAVPASRQVAVRYPLYKRGILGIALGDTITAQTAFGPSDIARVAAFNDCFVSSANDVGTYNVAGDREFWERETNYVSMGGETCAASQFYCNCEKTYENLIRYHWTYLNEAYNKKTHNVWRSEGCYDDIVKRLGYRLVLLGAAFEGEVRAGSLLTVKLHLENKGFASLINHRPMNWVLVNRADDSEKHVIPSSKDPREWKGSSQWVHVEAVTLPGLTPGASYKLCLELPDASPTLSGKPEFSVRFANADIWDERNGFNVLTTLTAE